MKVENNGHQSIRFYVNIIQSDGHNGQIMSYPSHKTTVPEAIQEALTEYLSEDRSIEMPMAGISVYQCVFTA